jgi:two-component system, NarL family, response regulator DevR
MNNPLRVLLIHDHQLREGVKHCLKQEPDIEVVGEAASAKEALLLVEQTRPSMVTLDLHLPDMSGLDLAQRLRKRWPELKILLLSGYDSEKVQLVQAARG